MKKNFVLFLAILFVSVSACKNPFFKNMLDKNSGNASSVPEKPQLPNPQEPAVPANPEVPEPQLPKYTLTFGVDGANGTLKATVDGSEINSGNKVEKSKSVVFTAEPDAGYVVKEWKVDGAVVTGNTSNTYTHTVTAAVDIKVSFSEGFAVLTLSPDKLNIRVWAKTSDGSAIVVEGCIETTLTSGTATILHAKGTRVVLKGKIIRLHCGDYISNHSIQNKLTALNVQGLSALQELKCNGNKLTVLNVQGLSNLQVLSCWRNQLTSLDVQGCTALLYLDCGENRLTTFDVQGLNALQGLVCWSNQLTALDVQGLSNLQGLWCGVNQLTALNVQGCTALKELYCWSNKLTALNIQGLSALRWLGCQSNQLTAQAFIKIFTDLPKRDAGDNAGCSLYTEKPGVTEGNCKDFTTPAELQAAFQSAKDVKKWKMYKVNTSGNSEEI